MVVSTGWKSLGSFVGIEVGFSIFGNYGYKSKRIDRVRLAGRLPENVRA